MATEAKNNSRIGFPANGDSNSKGDKDGLVFEVLAPITKDIFSVFIGKINKQILFNTDEVVNKNKEGKGIEIYQEMLYKDPFLAGLVQARKRTAASIPFEIVAAGEDAAAAEHAEFIEDIFSNLPRFRQDLFEAMDAISKGFAILEVVWVLNEENRVVVESLEARHQRRFRFGPDKEIYLISDQNYLPGELMPDKKFLVFRHGTESENPYGESVLRHCYWFWMFKKNIVKFWTMFLERFASPSLHATHPPGLNDDQKKELEKLVEDFQNQSHWVTSELIKIDVKESGRTGQETYHTFSKFCDEQMAKAIWGESMTSIEEKVGSLASKKVGAGIRLEQVKSDAEMLQDELNAHLIPWLVNFNFAGVTKYPKIVFQADPPEDLELQIARIEKLVNLGLPMSKQFLYDTFGMPIPSSASDIVEPPQQPGFGFGGGLGGKEKLMEGRSKTALLARHGGRVPTPPANLKTYDLRTVIKVRRRYAKQLDDMFENLSMELKLLLAKDLPKLSLIEDWVADNMPRQLARINEGANVDALRAAAESMAKMLERSISEEKFGQLMARYAKEYAYDLGAAKEMTETIRSIMANRIGDLFDSGKAVDEIRDEILTAWTDVTASRAEMIAITETQRAANWGALQMAKESGLKLKAWFIGPTTDEDLCHELMAGNPYDLSFAQDTLLPHPNCVHNWAVALDEPE